MTVGRVIVVGPASPASLASHLSERDRESAAAIQGWETPVLNSLVSALLKRGLEVELVTLTPEVTRPLHFSGPGLDMRISQYRSGRARYRAMDFFAQERRALTEMLALASGDVVHAHWTYEFALPCEHERRPVLVTAHDAPLTILRLYRDAYRLVRTVLAYRVRLGIRTLSAVSPYLAQRWRTEMVYRRPIMVVPNIAVGLPVVAPRPTAGRHVVLDVSDQGNRKNVVGLIRAFSEVRRLRPDTVLRLIGPGLDPAGELAGWARANGLDTSVEFVGPVNHTAIAYHLAEADVFAHAALEEAHPMSMCEAMHAGVPVVGGYHSGGVPWTLDGGRCGVLVDVRDPWAIADGILQLLSDPALARELGSAARGRALNAFGADTVVRGYLEAYATAIREQASGKRFPVIRQFVRWVSRVNAPATQQPKRARALAPGPVAARSLTARAFNAIGWSYVTGFFFLLSQIGYTAFTARVVSPSAFGGYALALTIVQLAGLFGTSGLADSVMRVHGLTHQGARTALTLAIGVGLLLSLVLVAVSPWIEQLFRTPGTAQALRLLALQPPMLAAAGVSYGLLRRRQRYRAASLIELTSCLAGFAVGAAAVAAGMSAAGLALGQVARGAVAMPIGLYWARISLRPAYDRARAREFLAFSLQVTGQNLGHYAIGSLPLWSVARMAGGTAAGLFSRAFQVVALPADQFAFAFMRAAYPLYREVSTSNDRIRRALSDALVLTSGACAVVFGVFAVYVQPATMLLLGARWHAAAEITPLLCAFAAVNTVYAVLASGAEAMRWMRMIWATQLAFLIIMAASLFIASGNLAGTAIAMIIATAVAHGFMLGWTASRGCLHVGEIIRAYPAHILIGLAIGVIPPLVSSLVAGQSMVAALFLRTGTLAVVGLVLWMLRDRVPGLRLGIVRLRSIRSPHSPRHRRGKVSQ